MLKLSLTLLICLTTLSGHALASFVVAPKDEPALQLTAEIIRQRYCIGDAELDALDLELRLRYRNTGSQPLILYKGSDYIDAMRVYRILANGTDVVEEINATYSLYTDGSPWNISESSLSRDFVILPPRGVYETRTNARVFVTREGVSQTAGSVGSGEHHLQITIPTWFGSDDLANRLQRRWRRNGLLWTRAVTSSSIRFVVERQRTIADCQ